MIDLIFLLLIFQKIPQKPSKSYLSSGFKIRGAEKRP